MKTAFIFALPFVACAVLSNPLGNGVVEDVVHLVDHPPDYAHGHRGQHRQATNGGFRRRQIGIENQTIGLGNNVLHNKNIPIGLGALRQRSGAPTRGELQPRQMVSASGNELPVGNDAANGQNTGGTLLGDVTSFDVGSPFSNVRKDTF